MTGRPPDERLNRPVVGAAPRLPPYSQALLSKRLCRIGLYFSYIVAAAALASSIYLIAGRGGVITITVTGYGQALGEAIPLLFNILVTGCTESISYIHAVSLRWALYREGRLEFNSNLRLFTSAKSSRVNSWPSNLVAAACLVMCYTAASQTFVELESRTEQQLLVNGVALLMLGVGLLLLSIISTLCLAGGDNIIKSWSPSPLNTALACLHHGIISRHPGRGMLSVHDRNLAAQPVRPRRSQRSMGAAFPATRYIAYFQYGIVVLSAASAVVVLQLVRTLNHVKSFGFLFSDSQLAISTTGFGVGGDQPYPLLLFCTFLFAFALQAIFVMALHAAELLVNVARDEAAWRAAYGTPKGATVSPGALQSASGSWLWLLLLVFKPVTGWLFTSQGIRFSIDKTYTFIGFNPMPLFAVTGMALVLLVLEEWLIRRRVVGPQPAAYGHLQTLVDLVDDWGSDGNGMLWWGAKGFNEKGEALAGTSATRDGVEQINMTVSYQ